MATYQSLKIQATDLTNELGREQATVERNSLSFEVSRLQLVDMSTRYFQWSQDCAAFGAANPDDEAAQALAADALRQVADIVTTRDWATALRDAVEPVPSPFE